MTEGLSEIEPIDVCVIDASLVVALFLDPGMVARVTREVGEPALIAPDHLTIEVLSALRRHHHRQPVDEALVEDAVDSLHRLPIDLHPVSSLVPGIWARRSTMAAHDAAYASLAAALNCPLLTADERMTRSPQLGCLALAFV